MSRFSRLIDEVSDQSNHALSDVLLKAKVLASRLRSRKFKQWIDSEIGGYDSTEGLPEYRVIPAQLHGDFAGYFGQERRHVPMSVSHFDPDMRHTLSHEKILNGVSYVEDILSCTLRDSLHDSGRRGR